MADRVEAATFVGVYVKGVVGRTAWLSSGADWYTTNSSAWDYMWGVGAGSAHALVKGDIISVVWQGYKNASDDATFKIYMRSYNGSFIEYSTQPYVVNSQNSGALDYFSVEINPFMWGFVVGQEIGADVYGRMGGTDKKLYLIGPTTFFKAVIGNVSSLYK